MGLDKVRGNGNGNGALKATVDAHIKDDDGKFDRLFDAIDEKVVKKLDAIQTDLSDVKQRVSRIEGWQEGRKEGRGET